jgi:hypothetical protein
MPHKMPKSGKKYDSKFCWSRQALSGCPDKEINVISIMIFYDYDIDYWSLCGYTKDT